MCCAEDQQELLVVDHISGLQGRERRSIYVDLALVEFDTTDLQVLCANCNQGKELNGGVCPKHGRNLGNRPDRPDTPRARWNLAKKQELFEHYGPCRCCGETTLEFLAIDHVMDNGSLDRSRGLKGNTLHRWLIRNNYPPGYQTLCFNCNAGKRFGGGTCPKHNVYLGEAD